MATVRKQTKKKTTDAKPVIEVEKKVRRKETDAKKDPSYISTYKNYKPEGGRKIEKSSSGEKELPQLLMRRASHGDID